MKRAICEFLLAISLFPLAGCEYAPPAGATRGIIEIKDVWEWDGVKPGQRVTWTNTLTGVVIGEHTVLTVAHSFEDEPEADHPILIDGRTLEYTIIADGWAGLRGESPIEKDSNDYVLLKTTESFTDFARLEPLKHARIDELRNLYLISRRVETDEIEAIMPKSVSFGNAQQDIIIDLPKWARERFYLSGSPLIGTYRDGTLVLLGILKAHGDVVIENNGKYRKLNHQYFVVPAYRIPFELVTEP